jgi:DNA modification methylase
MRSIEYINMDLIKGADQNPKLHDIDLIQGSIGRFGYVDPMIMDERTGQLVAGHGRLESLRARRDAGDNAPDGITRAPDGSWLVPVLRGWSSRSDADASAYLIADNRLSERGGWDHQALAELLDSIGDPDLVDIAGWDPADLDELLETTESDGDDTDDVGPATRNPSLVDRFGVPPFDVFDARLGYWKKRKQAWTATGIKSEIGRGNRLAYHGIECADPHYYEQLAAVESKIGRKLTKEEFLADHYQQPTTAIGTGNGTSIFDPVLCEIAYRWFCPPGGLVVDPFAGGAVRGVIAAAIGRRYHGIDLRPDQVDANRDQAEDLLTRSGDRGGTDAVVDDPTTITPIEYHGGYPVKRDDLFSLGGSRGGKVRSCLALIHQAGAIGVTTAGSRHSPQVNIVATIAAHLGLPCRVHVPAGGMTPELTAAQAAGAEVVQHTPGYNTVIIKRAVDDAAERGWLNIPFGMECQNAVDQTAAQVTNLDGIEGDRLVVPVGSGMTLAGILTGLAANRIDLPVTGIVVGADPEDRLDRYAPPNWRDMVDLVRTPMAYGDEYPDPVLDDLPLDPIYEAKCLPYLKPGDILWIVGRRQTATVNRIAMVKDPPMPEWTCGDSLNVLPGIESGSADLVFTCPPYYTLEKYSDDPSDLSTMTYEAFNSAYEKIIAECARILRPDRFMVIVTGDARDGKGILHDLRGETIRAATRAGLHYVTGAVLVTQVGSTALMAAQAFVATRTLGRVHQDVTIFVRGDRSSAARACGDVQIELEQLSDPDAAEDDD